MFEQFEKAAHFTMDPTLRDVLLNCSLGVFPKQFRVEGSNIVYNGECLSIPNDPMDICNMIHDIMTKKISKKAVVAPMSTTRARNGGFHLDELYVFAYQEADRLGKGQEHGDKIWGCIYSSIYLKTICPADLIYKNGEIIGIRGINTSIPCLTRG